MDTARSPYTVTDWALGLAAFVVFTVVALYVFLLTRPAGWNLAEWSLLLLAVTGTIQLAYAALRRRRQPR